MMAVSYAHCHNGLRQRGVDWRRGNRPRAVTTSPARAAMLIRSSLSFGAHLAAGVIFGAMAVALAAQMRARRAQTPSSSLTRDDENLEESTP